jgi:hypothetical protein
MVNLRFNSEKKISIKTVRAFLYEVTTERGREEGEGRRERGREGEEEGGREVK